MRTEYKLYIKLASYDEFNKFIRECELSGCYPWNINTLKINLDRQQRWPNRQQGYTPSNLYYDSSWTYTKEDSQEVVAWLSWMALKYNRYLEQTTLTIDELTNQVMENRSCR